MSEHLRYYQRNICASVRSELERVNSTMCFAATGSGKTIIMVELIRRFQPVRSLVLSHRSELVFQIKEKLKKFADIDCEIEMANYRASVDLFTQMKVVSASVASMTKKRRAAFERSKFGYIFVDECHHAKKDSQYDEVIADFKLWNPNVKIIGVTATPNRHDGIALGEMFDSCPEAQQYPITKGIADGFLVKPFQTIVRVDNLDLSKIHTTAGDLNGRDLDNALIEEKPALKMLMASVEKVFSLPENSLLNVPIEQWRNAIEGKKARRTLAFCNSVRLADILCNKLNLVRPGLAAFVDGETDKDHRKQINRDFACGQIPIICNCGTHTEGFDDDELELVLNHKPTKSLTLYTQILGRALRPLDSVADEFFERGLSEENQNQERLAMIAESSKPTAEMVDFGGHCGRHKIVSMLDVLGGKSSEAAKERALAKIKESGNPQDVEKLLEKTEEEIRAEIEEKRKREAQKRAKIIAPASYSTSQGDIFGGNGNGNNYKFAKPQRILTDGQRAFFIRNGMNPDKFKNFGHAMKVMAEIKSKNPSVYQNWNVSPATASQIHCLTKYGVDCKGLTKKQASEKISAIQANGWKRIEPVAVGQHDDVPF